MEAKAMRSGQFKGRIGKGGAGWLVAALLLIVIATGCSSLNEHVAMKDAAKAYKAGRFGEAAQFFKTALQFNPARAENWKYLGYCYWQQMEPGSKQAKDVEAATNALEAFRRYLEIVKKDDQIQDYIITIYVDQSRLDEGIKFYEKALATEGQDPRILQTLALMYARKGDFKKSLEYSERKASLAPNDKTGYQYIYALCWNKSRDMQQFDGMKKKILNPTADAERKITVDRGMKAVETVLRLDQNDFNAHLFKGLLFRQQAELVDNEAQGEKDRRRAKDLTAQAEALIKRADAEKDTALALRKAQQQAQSAQPSGAPAAAPTK